MFAWFSPCLFFCLVQSHADRKSQTNSVLSFQKLTLPSPFFLLYLSHGGQLEPDTNTLAVQRKSKGVTDLFDAVWVDGGLWLQDADWLCLLGALRHLPHLLSDEVVDAVECFHRPLD